MSSDVCCCLVVCAVVGCCLFMCDVDGVCCLVLWFGGCLLLAVGVVVVL